MVNCTIFTLLDLHMHIGIIVATGGCSCSFHRISSRKFHLESEMHFSVCLAQRDHGSHVLQLDFLQQVHILQ
jgi:hypothetical protein